MIAGASGLVGRHCLRILLERPEYERVTALVRRPLELSHPKLEQREVDFERLDRADLPPVDDVYCTLGTTIKTAGSKEAFLRVDYDYPRMLAERTGELGARRLLLVTSVATDPRSPNYYLKVKGRLEAQVAGLPFEAIGYFRPSFLAGRRDEARPGERVGVFFAEAFRFLLFGPMRIYRAIPAETVAAAMVGVALGGEEGRRIYHYDEMLALAR